MGTERTDTTTNKVDLAHDTIRQRIVDGTYVPGYRLVLSSIAEELGVSSVPVREAIRRLEAQSLVAVTRNVGATVKGLDIVEYRWAMESLAVLEGAATASAAPLIGDQVLSQAHALNEQMHEGLGRFDPVHHSDLNRRFHQILWSACPNPRIIELIDHGWTRLAMIRTSGFAFAPERAEGSVVEHDRLLELIADQASSVDIEMHMREHRMRTLRAVLASHRASDHEGSTAFPPKPDMDI